MTHQDWRPSREAVEKLLRKLIADARHAPTLRAEWDEAREATDEFLALPSEASTAPIKMVLFCPACGLQHIDAPDTHDEAADKLLKGERPWDNPPHRSHLCLGCGHIWRPADVPTEGVAKVETLGSADSPIREASTAPGQGGALTAQALERAAIDAVIQLDEWVANNAAEYEAVMEGDSPGVLLAEAYSKRVAHARKVFLAALSPPERPQTER